ncbi:MAG: VTT domain-containing protein [Anaerolineae bacterium]
MDSLASPITEPLEPTDSGDSFQPVLSQVQGHVEAPPPISRTRSNLSWSGKVFRFLIILAVLGISGAIFVFREQFAQLAAVGYSGIFVVSLLGNATIILPAPSLALVFAMGSALSPVWVGLLAGVGEALGELTGYGAGFGGRAIIENRKGYERLKNWMRRRGGITIFILSAIPNPFFDLAGIVAGTLGYSPWRFLLFCWLGKTIKTTAVAFAGSLSISFIEQFLG